MLDIEIYNLLIDFAEKDENIRVVSMNGSRVDINIKKDIFQDFDIVYLLNDLRKFNIEDFLSRFPKIAIMQVPEPPSLINNSKSHLIQFIDGNRIDLRLIEIEFIDEYLKEDSLTRILLDKDDRVEGEIIPSDKIFWNRKPSYEEYYELCNEFLWISLYIAKAIVRDEFIHARRLLDENYRPELIKLLAWKVGIDRGFDFSLGKYDTKLDDYLSKNDWDRLMGTYDDGDYHKIWNILFNSLEFFNEIGIIVGENFNYKYPLEEYIEVKKLLELRSEYKK